LAINAGMQTFSSAVNSGSTYETEMNPKFKF
jgi:hypothetical protein